MRKIELRMRELIRNNGGSASGNTRVTRDDNLNPPFTHSIYLHGKHIADAWAHADGFIKAVPDRETLEEWPTPTTISRLRALDIDVYQSNKRVFIGNNQICDARKPQSQEE